MGSFAFLGIPSFHFLGLNCGGQLSAYVAIFLDLAVVAYVLFRY